MRNTSKVHYWYIIGILVAAIVILVTVEWSRIEGLASLISFASTLAALILAILAIVYSVYSSSHSIGAATSLQESAQEIAEVSDLISKTSQALSLKIEEIPSSLAGIGAQLNATHQLVAEMKSEGLSQFQTDMSDETDRRMTFEGRVAAAGLITLYAAAKATNSGKEINLEELEQILEQFNAQYSKGFMVGVHGTGKMSLSISGNVIKVLESESDLFKNTEEALNERIATEEDELAQTIRHNMQRIDAYYKSAASPNENAD